MNLELHRALAEAISALGDSLPTDWRRIVMMKNDGPIPVPSRPLIGDPDRGFNLLLLSGKGEPLHYVRCRAATDSIATREAVVLQRLSSIPHLRRHLPEATSSRGANIQVLASRYMRGPALARMLRTMSVSRWLMSLCELTDLARTVGSAADHAIPNPRAQSRFCFALEARDSIKSLAASGLSDADSMALMGVLEGGGSVERFLQHGDLWPGNVIRERGVWRLLDFELFGRVDAPLFDACYLTYTSAEYLLTGGRGFGGTWIGQLQAGRPLGLAAREVLRRSAESYALAARERVAAVVYCFVEMCDRLRRRGARPLVWQKPLAELSALSGMIRSGADLDSALFCSPHELR